MSDISCRLNLAPSCRATSIRSAVFARFLLSRYVQSHDDDCITGLCFRVMDRVNIDSDGEIVHAACCN